MKKHIYTITIMAILAGIYHSGCTDAAPQGATSTTTQTTKFDNVQGDCTNGGVKIEVLVDGVVDETQTQYICNGAQGENGQDGQDGQDGQGGTSTNIKTTKFDGAQGDCTNGGVKIEVLVNGVVDSTQTQYICNSAAPVTCGNGVLEAGEACDGGFIAEGAAPSCASGQEAADTLVCVTGGCTFDLTASCKPAEVCGDNKVGANEICDIVDGNTVINTIFAEDYPNGLCFEYDSKYVSGSLVCNATCDDFDVTQCVEASADVCGDNKVGADEFCDIVDGKTVINPISAEDYPNGLCTEYDSKYVSGSLVCNATCDDFDVTQCVESPAEVYVVGDIITFGHYDQDNDDTNGKDPIEWRVLDVNAEGQLLVISEKVLEKKRYNETWIAITWEKSTIRSWLNGYAASYNSNGVNYTSNNFIDAAFTAEEQAKIVASNVPAHKNPKYSTSPGNATTDKIFLLSIVEAQQYFASNTDRLGDATRYAVKQCLYVRATDTVSTSGGTLSSDGRCTNVYHYAAWWLRSPGVESDLAAPVSYQGAVFTSGYDVSDDNVGVRPALWLDY